MDLESYRQAHPSLRFETGSPRILEIVLAGDAGVNTADAAMHRDLAMVWRRIDADASVAAVIVRGAGEAFSAGGDYRLIESMMADDQTLLRVWKEARDLVYNLVNCGKPVVAAIRGPAVGAGLAVALLADISIATPDARLLDGHTRLGVAAGDHAVMIWPLLLGMAKVKYHLLTNTPLTGAEAERLGMISLCVPAEELLEEARRVAGKVASASPTAIRWTKYALNNWLRQAGPSFDAGLALEFLGFRLGDARRGLDALREKREADYDPDCPL
jgi:enoyl-CoA hydratase